jgi:hypothetical protein
MPRQLKPYSVGEVVDSESGVRVPLFLDRNASPKVFFGEVFGERLAAATEVEVKRLVLARLREGVTYEWERIVVVHTQGSFGDRGLIVEFGEREIARRPAGGDPCRPWVERRVRPVRDRVEATISSYSGPTESRPEDGVFVLPWSEATMLGLRDIKARLDLLRARLREVLGAPEAPVLLARLVKALPAPAEAPAEAPAPPGEPAEPEASGTVELEAHFQLGPDAAPWCQACGSYHVAPADAAHHQALRCRAPWPPAGAPAEGSR